MWFFNLLAATVLLLGGIASATSAKAQAGMAGRPVAVCVARAVPGMTPGSLFATLHRFDCTTPQARMGRGDFWAISSPIAASGPANVRVGSLWQTRMTLHALYADGVIVSAAIDERGASRRIQLGAIIEQPLPARPAPLVRLLWHVEGAANLRGILIGAQIATPAESAQANLTMGAFYAGFAGLCIALLIYNLALWGALRHRFQLAYCAMLFALLLYTFSSSGTLA